MIIKVVLVLHARTRCLCLLGCLLCRTFNGIVSAKIDMHSKWMEEEMSHQHSKFVRMLMHKTHWSNPLTTQASPFHYKYKMFSVLYERISAYVYVFHFVNTDDIQIFFVFQNRHASVLFICLLNVIVSHFKALDHLFKDISHVMLVHRD